MQWSVEKMEMNVRQCSLELTQFQSGVASPMHLVDFCPVVIIRDAYRCE